MFFEGSIFPCIGWGADSKERPAREAATKLYRPSENIPPAKTPEIMEGWNFGRGRGACEIFHKFSLPQFRREK